jgi:tight adherence protein C
MSWTGIAAIVFTALAVAYIAYVSGRSLQRASDSANKRVAGLGGTTDVADLPFRDRVLGPMGQRIGALGMRLSPQAWIDRSRRRLVRAGWYPDIDETSWAAIKLVTFIGCAVLFALLAVVVEGAAQWLVFFILAIIGTVGPDQLLNRRVDERVGAIERDLPDIIDLMVISIEAGLGFDSALDRVVRHVPGELSDEFGRMMQETRVGVSRSEAMRNLAKRTDVDDLNSFVLALNQADSFGVSIGKMLRVQAEEMRIRRRQRAQERAFAAPVKMVFPLVLCVFPALFVVMLGPAAISVADNLLGG